MRFSVRSAVSITCGLLLFPQQVAADVTCADTDTFGNDACLAENAVCSAKEITIGGLTMVEAPDGACDGSDGPEETVTFTGNLKFDTNAARADVAMILGPFDDGTCNTYWFVCNDSPALLDGKDEDNCADVVSKATTFEGISFTAPCAGNANGDLAIDYCISWKTPGEDNGETCPEGDDPILIGTPAKCNCDEANVLVIREVKVCPVKTDFTVTVTAGPPPCYGDGTNFIIDIAGTLPTGAEAVYVLTDEDENETVLGDTTVTVVLKPEADYTLDVIVTFPDVPKDCEPLIFDLNPTCVCETKEDCACDPDDDPLCTSSDLICCVERNVCDEFSTGDNGGTACGDPHMTGFLGQKFDFTGEDGGWYSVIADSNMNVNMRVTSPVVDLPEITYITGLSVLTIDADGFDHSIVIEVADPHSLDSSCPAGVSPCLADGALRVLLDGDEALFAPGTVSLGLDVEISAVNLPGACRSFGFEKYWERKKLEYATGGRHLRTQPSMGEWILGDPTATNMDECVEYVARAEAEGGGVFAHQSEHASFQIVTPAATVRLSHGRLHQIAMRDPTDQYDLPDHLTWQMDLAVDHNEVSHAAKGILGETFVPTRDASGKPIVTGMEAIRGTEEDYRVEGPLGIDFIQDAHTS